MFTTRRPRRWPGSARSPSWPSTCPCRLTVAACPTCSSRRADGALGGELRRPARRRPHARRGRRAPAWARCHRRLHASWPARPSRRRTTDRPTCCPSSTPACRPPAWGVLLVRKGGFAIARLRGDDLVESKVGQRHVQGRTKAGGQSQQRFARRRDNQARAAYEAAAEHAARILPGVRRSSPRAVTMRPSRRCSRTIAWPASSSYLRSCGARPEARGPRPGDRWTPVRSGSA